MPHMHMCKHKKNNETPKAQTPGTHKANHSCYREFNI